MSDLPKKYALWDALLSAWPISRLATMTLDDQSAFVGTALLSAYQAGALTALRQPRLVFLANHLSSRSSSHGEPHPIISRYLASLVLGHTSAASVADPSSN